eukprot:TRINITY_DN90449_c0_g1_i1.p1 TRINITY_DN90449_c0_g1~~TRINITY_DN90449_c0_g1_i1.p1  ORF type:complete len:462 (-),score=102.68 TRINITY_DN90449_c0_g1_i1:156-1541(-)
MELLLSILGACSDVQKSGKPPIIHDDDASDMQLNAFEFRNYRTSLQTAQHRLLERVVNQWCAMLVKGKTLKINDFEEKLFLDKDMMNLEYSGELYPLRAITRMEMFKDTDDMMMDVPWGLDITFSFMKGDSSIRINFAQERHRLNFALTLRILRTRDPSLDPSSNCEVLAKDDEDEEEDDEKAPFAKAAATQRFNVEDAGIPIVFSLVDLKIFQKLYSTSRHVYLEFFVRYPRQDRFLYAKSGTTHIPQAVLAAEDGKKKKKAAGEDDDKDQQNPADEKKDEVLCTMKFDMKNVKLKIPRAPHTIFGRLMAKDDYFPTAVGTFELDLKKSYLQDRREIDPAELEELRRQQKRKSGKKDKAVVDGMRTDPEMLSIPVISTWKSQDDMKPYKIGALGLRLIGYVLDVEKKAKKRQGSSDNEEEEGQNEDNDEEEEGDDEDEEEEEAQDSVELEGTGEWDSSGD